MKETGRAVTQSLVLHVVLVLFLLVLPPWRQTPSRPTPVAFSLLPPREEFVAAPLNEVQASPKMAEAAARPQQIPSTAPPAPVRQRPPLARATPSRVAPQTVPRQPVQPPETPDQADTSSPPPPVVDGSSESPARQTAAVPIAPAEQASAYRQDNYSAIRHAILGNLRYPAIARRQGWTGKVEIAFLVTLNGGIDEVRVQTSSGHGVLDEEAMSAVRRAAPYKPPRVPTFLVMPVVFTLQ